jgi:actin-like ATPase involved in cell morphogenesis
MFFVVDVLSIDFGTSFTAAAIASNGAVSVVAFSDGATRMPSSVFWSAAEKRLVVGTMADNYAAMNPSLYEPTPKRWVGQGQVPLAGVEISDTDCVAAVLGEVASEVRRQRDGQLPTQVVLTHPAAWRKHKLTVLRDAAHRAGLGDPTFIAEPCAAAAYFAATGDNHLQPTQALCVYDLGGGTFDAAVVIADDHGYELAGPPDGIDPLGGETFDYRLFEHVGKYIAGRDSTVWAHLETPDTEHWARHRRNLLIEVRRAKEALSKVRSHDLFIPGLNDSLLLTRDELETLITDDIDHTIDTALAAVARAGHTPTTLTGIYLAGGSSRIPMVAQKIYDRTDTPPHTVDDPKLIVVKGAATTPLTTKKDPPPPPPPPPGRPGPQEQGPDGPENPNENAAGKGVPPRDEEAPTEATITLTDSVPPGRRLRAQVTADLDHWKVRNGAIVAAGETLGVAASGPMQWKLVSPRAGRVKLLVAPRHAFNPATSLVELRSARRRPAALIGSLAILLIVVAVIVGVSVNSDRGTTVPTQPAAAAYTSSASIYDLPTASNCQPVTDSILPQATNSSPPGLRCDLPTQTTYVYKLSLDSAQSIYDSLRVAVPGLQSLDSRNINPTLAQCFDAYVQHKTESDNSTSTYLYYVSRFRPFVAVVGSSGNQSDQVMAQLPLPVNLTPVCS